MEAVTNQHSRSARIRPLVVAAAASVAIAALIGVGAYTGVLPSRQIPLQDPLGRADARPAQPSTCALCGTIESVRTVEVYDEVNTANGTAEPKNGVDTAGAGPGGAITESAMSVLDSISGAVTGGTEKNVRKRLVWRVTLRMDDGSFRAISMASPPVFLVGEKVRVVEGRLVRS
jgi:outer membrane lipoprotein SlyB